MRPPATAPPPPPAAPPAAAPTTVPAICRDVQPKFTKQPKAPPTRQRVASMTALKPPSLGELPLVTWCTRLRRLWTAIRNADRFGDALLLVRAAEICFVGL